MTYALSEHTILRIWEQGLSQHPVEQALTILAIILPDMPQDVLLGMSIGVRDTHLLTVRERTFGSRFASYAECQQCQERLEFTFTTADIHADTVSAPASEHMHQIVVHDYDVRMRMPNTSDMLAMMQVHIALYQKQGNSC